MFIEMLFIIAKNKTRNKQWPLIEEWLNKSAHIQHETLYNH